MGNLVKAITSEVGALYREPIPYSTFTKILLASGIDCPLALGFNCFGLIRHLREQLARLGIESKYIIPIGGDINSLSFKKEDIHGALLVDGQFYCDLGLLQIEPVLISDMLNATNLLPVRCGAYPIMNGSDFTSASSKSTRIVAFKTDRGLYVKKIFFPNNEKRLVADMIYALDEFDKGSSIPENNDRRVAFLPQAGNCLKLSFVNKEGCNIKIELPLDSDQFRIAKIGGALGNKWVTLFEGQEGFLKGLEEIEQILQIRAQEILDYMRTAKGIYAKNQSLESNDLVK